MRVLSLLFDPRGAIDRRTFWSGLIQLMVISVVVCTALSFVDIDAAWAALPVIGEAFATTEVAGQVRQGALPDVSLVAGMFLVAARLYVTVCLMLKRSRDAGKGARPLIAFGLVGLAIHGLMGLWAYDLFDDGMALIVPFIADAMATAALGLVFSVWLGALPSSSASKPARAWRSPQVKPSS